MTKNLKDLFHSRKMERYMGKKSEFVMPYAVTSNHFLIISILIIQTLALDPYRLYLKILIPFNFDYKTHEL